MDYEEMDKLGSSDYSTVYITEQNGLEVVRKEVNAGEKSSELAKRAENEIEMHKKLRDRNIARLIDYSYSEKDKKYYLYKDLEKYDLDDEISCRVKPGKDFTFEEVICYMRCLVRGLKFIHRKGIIHRNLDCKNILITLTNTLRINGLSLAIKKDNGDYDLVGNVDYMAPELFETPPPQYSEASDVFSLGCIFYKIYTLNNAYKGKEKREKVLKFERRTEERVDKIEKLIEKMLLSNSDKRITLKEVEEEIDRISPIPDPSIDLCRSIQEFYLEKGKMIFATLDDMLTMGEHIFSAYWRENLIPKLFPSIGQECPPYTLKDAQVLKEKKNEFKERLYKLIDLCFATQYNVEYMINFLTSIDELKYFNDLKEEKKKTEDLNDLKEENKPIKYYNYLKEDKQMKYINDLKEDKNTKEEIIIYKIKDSKSAIEDLKIAIENMIKNEKDLCKIQIILEK